MNWSSFEFQYPYMFLLLGLYLLCRIYCKVQIKEVFFSNVKLIEQITSKENKIKDLLEFLVVLFLVIALASPVLKEVIQKTDTSGYEIAITLDASESMRDDNRFNITKEIVSDFITHRKGDRIALSLFAEDVYLAVPFTFDKKPLQTILEYTQIGVAGSVGTSLYDALYLSGNLFKDSHSKNKICILLTDGIDTKNNIALDIAINNVKKYGVKVYVVAVGKEDEFNKNILESIATKTNGTFFHTTNPKDLNEIYSKINTLEKSKIETKKYTKIEYLYFYPLIVVLVSIFLLVFKNVEKKQYLILMLALIVLAFIKPTIDFDNTQKQKSVKFIIALDISKSMMASDIKPNRFEFAKQKINTIIDNLEDEEVALVAFSNQTYLMSPFTKNYEHLKTFIKNLQLSNINQNGTEYKKLLESSDKLFGKFDKKALLVFTDGGESSLFKEEIQYAKEHQQTIFAYLIGTKVGSAIKINGELVRDNNKNIVLSKVNETIIELTSSTNGDLFYSSNANNDFISFLERMDKDFNSNDGYSNHSEFPLFIFFLSGSLVLFFLWRFEVIRWKK
jgi:Ca-activated chloride channel family protein